MKLLRDVIELLIVILLLTRRENTNVIDEEINLAISLNNSFDDVNYLLVVCDVKRHQLSSRMVESYDGFSRT